MNLKALIFGKCKNDIFVLNFFQANAKFIIEEFFLNSLENNLNFFRIICLPIESYD